jgi:hypothetical protein
VVRAHHGGDRPNNAGGFGALLGPCGVVRAFRPLLEQQQGDAHAGWGMARQRTPDRPRITIAFLGGALAVSALVAGSGGPTFWGEWCRRRHLG